MIYHEPAQGHEPKNAIQDPFIRLNKLNQAINNHLLSFTTLPLRDRRVGLGLLGFQVVVHLEDLTLLHIL